MRGVLSVMVLGLLGTTARANTPDSGTWDKIWAGVTVAQKVLKIARPALTKSASNDWGLTSVPTPPFPNKRLVVVLHGLHSSPETTSARFLIPEIEKKGLKAVLFSYPNDQPIADSAKMLSTELKKLTRQFPGLKVTLIGKSMGGLVIRDAVERPNSPRNVDKVIQIATPNQGSRLASFAFALEVWEHVVDAEDLGLSNIYDSIKDGLGEAADDLSPGSPFLKTLNGRPRNQAISYSIFLGDRGYLTEEQLAVLRTGLNIGSERLASLLKVDLTQMLADLNDLDEVLAGKGDGAVSIERGRLAGVSDTVVMHFDHLGASENHHQLRQAVLSRLIP